MPWKSVSEEITIFREALYKYNGQQQFVSLSLFHIKKSFCKPQIEGFGKKLWKKKLLLVTSVFSLSTICFPFSEKFSEVVSGSFSCHLHISLLVLAISQIKFVTQKEMNKCMAEI